jgi:DNA-binding Xre family transcriptional regulator
MQKYYFFPFIHNNKQLKLNIFLFFFVFSDFFCYFAFKFKILNMVTKDLNRLKLVLVEKKKTGVWLSEQLGVTAVTVSKWCNNVTQPTLPTLDRIAELLEVDPRQLIIGNE